MMKSRGPLPPVMLVDDEPEILFGTGVILRKAGLNNVESIGDSRAVLPFLAKQEAGVVVLDLQMPHISGKELLVEIAANYPHVPVIIMTAANDLDTAVECMKSGALDYLTKPIEPTRFVACVRKALEINALRREVVSLRDSLLSARSRDESAFSAFTTRSARMAGIFGYLEALAETPQPVLVSGETGVGKELAARAIHTLSGRNGRFVAVNSAGLDDSMFSDTLFGHKKGAFTGADQARDGMIAMGADGTLFLDEIGDMAMASQIKLLRLLQEGEYYPLGSDVARFNEARIIVATNMDLQKLVAEGLFRKDLYYRLSAHHVRIPPLRDRFEDIPLLLELFLNEAAITLGKKKPSYPPELMAYLASHDFPGNIRELKGMVFDAMARHKGGVLSLAVFKEAIGKNAPLAGRISRPCRDADQWPDLSLCFPTLKEAERKLVQEALERAGGNQGAAASLLGISRQALNKRLKKKDE